MEFPRVSTLEIDCIRDESERKTMCRKINELRRERCIMLSSPSQREHWHDETWTMTLMSREICRRFREIFRIIPLATSNPVKWKSTLEYLKKRPETPDRSNPTRCIDASTWESPDRGRVRTRSPNLHTSTPRRNPLDMSHLPEGLKASTGWRGLHHHRDRQDAALRKASPKSSARGWS